MATATTTNLGLTTVQAGDVLPEAVTKTNFETLDQYVAATALTNKSGTTRSAGDVVVADTTANSSFTTTVTAGYAQVMGVVQATILNNASGVVKFMGTSTVSVTGTTVRGDWLTTSTTAGKALPVTAPNSPPAGTFGIALTAVTGAGTVTALLLGPALYATITRVADLPAFSMLSPTSNGAADGTTHGTNHSYRTKDFDTTTKEHVDFEIVIPSTYTGGNITWTFYWTAASGSGGVSWSANVASPGNDDVFDAAKTQVVLVQDTLTLAGDLDVIAGTQSTSLPSAGDVLTVRIDREVADANDTLAVDAQLIRVAVSIPTNPN